MKSLHYSITPKKSEKFRLGDALLPHTDDQIQSVLDDMRDHVVFHSLPQSFSSFVFCIRAFPFQLPGLKEEIMSMVELSSESREDSLSQKMSEWQVKVSLKEFSEQESQELLELANLLVMVMNEVRTLTNNNSHGFRALGREKKQEIRDLWISTDKNSPEKSAIKRYLPRLRAFVTALRSISLASDMKDPEYFDIHEIVGFEREMIHNLIIKYPDQCDGGKDKSFLARYRSLIAGMIFVGGLGFGAMVKCSDAEETFTHEKQQHHSSSILIPDKLRGTKIYDELLTLEKHLKNLQTSINTTASLLIAAEVQMSSIENEVGKKSLSATQRETVQSILKPIRGIRREFYVKNKAFDEIILRKFKAALHENDDENAVLARSTAIKKVEKAREEFEFIISKMDAFEKRCSALLAQ